MRTLAYITMIATLTGFSLSAAAGTSSSSVFVQQDHPILVAQAKALDQYSEYLHRMMMQDKNMMPMLDANDDGEVSEQEFARAYKRAFKKFDRNGDGMIDKSEISGKKEMSDSSE